MNQISFLSFHGWLNLEDRTHAMMSAMIARLLPKPLAYENPDQGRITRFAFPTHLKHRTKMC